MAFVFSARHYEQQSELYHQLASMTSAGVGVIEACEFLRKSPPHRRMRDPLANVNKALRQGLTFAEALRAQKGWLPDFDISLIEASEMSGRMDACFRMLADYYAERSKLVRRVISELTWPIFTLHVAILIFPTSSLVGLVLKGETQAFFLQKLGVIIPLYAVVAAFIVAGQSRHGERWRGIVERMLHAVPILGAARRNLALARLSAALEALLSAGMPILDAWLIAAKTCGSSVLRAAIQNWTPRLRSGATPGEMILQAQEFPPVFSNLYHTGEVSGKLDDTLRRLYTMFSEEASRKFHAFSQWLPRLLMLGIMLGIAIQVLSFWLGYFNSLSQSIGP